MQQSTCTEDRILHALNRCLDGLNPQHLTNSWNPGWCMNRWSLEELVKRNPENVLVLMQQILRKAREVQQEHQYDLVVPLALLFESSLLQVVHCPSDGAILREAVQVFHGFLSWPEPFSSTCHSLLSKLNQELRAPGITFHRLVREEQGLDTSSQRSKILTVLLINPAEVPTEYLFVAEQLSRTKASIRDSSVELIKHCFQSVLGCKCSLQMIDHALQSLSDDGLSQVLESLITSLETAAVMADVILAREYVQTFLESLLEKLGLPASDSTVADGMLQNIRLPVPKCYTFHWDTDNFDVLNKLLEMENENTLAQMTNKSRLAEDSINGVDTDDNETEDFEEMEAFAEDGCADYRASTFSNFSCLSSASKDSMFSALSVASSECGPISASSPQVSGADSDFYDDEENLNTDTTSKSRTRAHLSQRFSRFLRPHSSSSIYRAKSLGCHEAKELETSVRSRRSNSLPQQVRRGSHLGLLVPPLSHLQYVFFRRRPILSMDDKEEPVRATILRVVVFGSDHVAGRVCRAYSSLRKDEKRCPYITKAFRLKFFFVPVRRASVSSDRRRSAPSLQLSDGGASELEGSTNDIANLLGMLDPWYERNTLSLLELPVSVLCQSLKKDACEDALDGSLSLFADLLLYYCRQASCPALIQLYQAEMTLAGGEKITEVFVHSLELGHAAGSRAIRAMGAASKRFGLDGEREAVPLSLDVTYYRKQTSGRSQKWRAEKSCTSINLLKACRNPQELDSKMECLYFTMTEVLKRQSSKKGFNQILSTTRVKVDQIQVIGTQNTTFAVCLDQDEKKILQSVTRCEVSVCRKPDRSSDWIRRKEFWSQIQPINPSFCSLLCLPIASFSGAPP